MTSPGPRRSPPSDKLLPSTLLPPPSTKTCELRQDPLAQDWSCDRRPALYRSVSGPDSTPSLRFEVSRPRSDPVGPVRTDTPSRAGLGSCVPCTPGRPLGLRRNAPTDTRTQRKGELRRKDGTISEGSLPTRQGSLPCGVYRPPEGVPCPRPDTWCRVREGRAAGGTTGSRGPTTVETAVVR